MPHNASQTPLKASPEVFLNAIQINKKRADSSANSKLFEIFVFVLVHHYLPFARNVEQKYTDYKIFKEDLTLLFFERQKSPHMAGWRLTT